MKVSWLKLSLLLALLAASTSLASAQRTARLTAVASPTTTGTLNVYRRSASCKTTNWQFKLIAQGVQGTTTGGSTTFSYVDYKVYGSQVYCYYVTISGGSVVFPQSGRYQALFSTGVATVALSMDF